MHKIKAAFDGSHRETGKARPVEVKPSWVIALENNDMPRLSELAKSEDGLLPHVFEGHVGSLEINGKWTPLALACMLDNGSAVTLLLASSQDPYRSFHRLGISYSPMVYCRTFDKSFAYSALRHGGVPDVTQGHHTTH